MSHDTLGPAFWRIGRAAGPADPRTDAELVAAFVTSRCDVAFAELVARHGPVVLGTCRRILGNTPDADDAFQAVFLVLARRASSVRPPGAVGAWLYGVAWKVATKARGQAAKWAARDRLAAKPEAVSDPMTDPTLRPLLDAELARLPDVLRTVVVLCDLGGKSRSEAAQELGWPEGTVATRLAKGRAALAARLARRGVTLSVAGLAAAISPGRTSALVPSDLFESTLTATAAATGITPAAVALANGAARAMTLAKLVPALMVVFVGGLALAGAAVLIQTKETDRGPKSTALKTRPSSANRRPEPIAAPPAKPEDSSPWKEAEGIKLRGWLPGSLAYTPDGKTLVVGGSGGHVRAFDSATKKQQWDATVVGNFAAVAVSHDGKTVGATGKDGVQFLDPSTGKKGNVLEEKDNAPMAVGFFPDKTVGNGVKFSQVIFGSATGYDVKSWLEWPKVSSIRTTTTPKGKKPADEYAVPLAVDPKGEHAVITGPIDPKTGMNVLWAYACGGRGGNHLLEGHKASVICAAWSGDGKKIVTGDVAGGVVLWDATTFKKLSAITIGGIRVNSVAITDDGSWVATAGTSSRNFSPETPNYKEIVQIWDVSGNSPSKARFPTEALATQGGNFIGIASLAFSPDGTELAAAFCNFDHLKKSGELTGTVRVWKLAEKEPPTAPKPTWQESVVTGDHSQSASSIAFAPDGKTFVTGGFDNSIAVWDAATLKLRNSFPIKDADGKGLAVAYRPDGKLIAVATRTTSVALYDPLKGNDTRIDGQSSWAGGATTLAFSPDGSKLTAIDPNALRVIDTTKRGSVDVRKFDDPSPVPTQPILADVTWSTDGKYFHDLRRVTKGDTWALMIRGADGEAKRQLHDTTNAITCLGMGSDMESLAKGKADGTVDVITPESGPTGTIPAPPGRSTVKSVRFTPDAKKLAVVYDASDEKGNPVGGLIRVYDMTERYADLGGATLKDRLVYDFSMSSDGKTIAVVTIDPAEANSPKLKATEIRVWVQR
ncbi:MAG TPA: sigma-70 family RNA polymerase sigma factor [Fimbriiglobus sp.]|jgi:RNA polymerase sigma factor (sigma-70 family)